MGKKKCINIMVDEDDFNYVERYCQNKGINKSFLLREAISLYICDNDGYVRLNDSLENYFPKGDKKHKELHLSNPAKLALSHLMKKHEEFKGKEIEFIEKLIYNEFYKKEKIETTKYDNMTKQEVKKYIKNALIIAENDYVVLKSRTKYFRAVLDQLYDMANMSELKCMDRFNMLEDRVKETLDHFDNILTDIHNKTVSDISGGKNDGKSNSVLSK